MGKVYLKTKYDHGMNMEIPHSCNIAAAMYGFREMGAEIITYHSIDDIFEDVRREDIVLDYIDQCNAIFKKFGVIPRVVRQPDGNVAVDLTGKMNGRGAYICRNKECLKKAAKTGSIARSLEISLSEEIYKRLEEELM